MSSISAHAPPTIICKDSRDTLRDASRVALRVICVPQAGMGAWAFHGWQAQMPAGVEVLPVEMPGRNSRMGEPKPESMEILVADLCEGLRGAGAFDLPYVLLGHSLGAWVAFELCASQLRDRRRAPSLLIVSGARPPHLSALEHDADRSQPAISHLPDAEFWAHFERRYGRNPDLDDPSGMVKSFVAPLLRADFKILESYQPSLGRGPLPCPVFACAAAHDERLSPGQLQEWQCYAQADAFRQTIFATTPLPWSTPHRYLVEAPSEFQETLARECSRLLDAIAAANPK